MLESNILIDFFLTVGMPESDACEMIKMINSKYDKYKESNRYKQDSVFQDVEKFITNAAFINKKPLQCLLNLYPDSSSNVLEDNDPRKNYLDTVILKLADYAFPMGFKALH